MNASTVAGQDLRSGDFDGDGKTDILSTWGGKWHVSWGGTSPWQDLNTSGYVVSNLGFGDFDGDGITDVWTVQQERHVALEIRRFTRVTLSNRTADAILARATNVLQTDDPPGDMTCLAHFARVGNVTEFTGGDGSVDSQAEFNALTTYSAISQVKAVIQITWCGGFAANIIGCSPTPGTAELVTLQGSSLLDGILWTHEYGHTRGITGDYSAPTAFVMNGTISSNNRRVMLAECKSFILK